MSRSMPNRRRRFLPLRTPQLCSACPRERRRFSALPLSRGWRRGLRLPLRRAQRLRASVGDAPSATGSSVEEEKPFTVRRLDVVIAAETADLPEELMRIVNLLPPGTIRGSDSAIRSTLP